MHKVNLIREQMQIVCVELYPMVPRHLATSLLQIYLRLYGIFDFHIQG